MVEEKNQVSKAGKKGIKARADMVSGTARGSGTTYSCLYSTARSPGTKYSTVKDKAKDYTALKKKRRK